MSFETVIAKQSIGRREPVLVIPGRRKAPSPESITTEFALGDV
ncbi:MAG: hypothetical protein WA303_05675 [Bradyrhizobium sp.]|jgi:hypothetical protein